MYIAVLCRSAFAHPRFLCPFRRILSTHTVEAQIKRVFWRALLRGMVFVNVNSVRINNMGGSDTGVVNQISEGLGFFEFRYRLKWRSRVQVDGPSTHGKTQDFSPRLISSHH